MILTLIEKLNLGQDVKSFIFKPAHFFSWTAGQYLIYSLEHKNADLRGKMRFFTISSAPFEKNIAITTRIYKKNGSSFKQKLDDLKINGKIEAKGPDGNFVLSDTTKKYVFVAGGIGITPFRSILKQIEFEKKNFDITLLYFTKKNPIFKKELENLKIKDFKIKYFVGKRINKNDLKDIDKDSYFYISGPEAMVEKTSQLLKSLEINSNNLKHDYFSGY